jgi:hypothetical protein
MIFCLFVNESNHLSIDSRAAHFRFGFYKKKIIKSKFFKKNKPNRSQFKPTGFGSVRFFWTKTGLARFFLVWLVFFCFFSDLGSIRFFQF